MIKKFNENFIEKLYLISEDGGDCLHSKGVYNNIDKFIEDIKLEISNKKGWDINNIVIERTENDLKLKHDYSYEIFYIEEVTINKLLIY